MERMYSHDFNHPLSYKDGPSVEDQEAMNMIKDSCILKGGRLQVSLPWRGGREVAAKTLPTEASERMARFRTKKLGEKLRKDPVTFQMVKDQIEIYLKEGYAEIVPPDEIKKPTQNQVMYPPTLAVKNPNKPGKVRFCHDCAAKPSGISLNSCLLPGEQNANSLLGCLIRSREHPIFFMCDIEACFHRILVDPQDIDALRFFFWKDFDLNQPYVVFRMLVHLFGSTSSPAISTFAIRYLAELFKNEYPPEVILAILWNLYVDDLIKSCPDVQSAIKLINGLVNLLKRGGFRLTKFVSNSREVLAAIPSEDRAKSVKDFDESTLPVERALGVKLDVEDDAFVFKVSHLKVGEIRNTRRLILGLISSVWDPIGFLACVLLKGRRILQVLTCDKRYGWDEVISDEELEEFQEWALSLLLLETMKVPRWIGSPALGKIASTQLHFCSDASDTAYGACAYIRKADEAGNIHAALVAAKSRVTPLKHQCEFDINGSMPKMEFCAGVVAVQLFIFLISEMGLEFDEVWFWCDSTCVIRWVRNRTTRHKPFVFNRISQILAATKMEQWRYCPTDLNPAHLCSHGFKSDDQESWNFFLTGGFLQRPSSEWPENPLDAAPAEDVVANLAATSIAPSFNFIGKLSERVSSWAKLVKHLIWWKRFKSYLMEKFLPNRKCKATVGPISVAEMKTAEADIFVSLQEDHFSPELSYLNEIEADELFRVIGKQMSLNSKDSHF